VALHDRHSVCRQRSGLIRTDGSSVAHRLTGVQVTHQVVVVHHFLNKYIHSVTVLDGKRRPYWKDSLIARQCVPYLSASAVRFLRYVALYQVYYLYLLCACV